MGGMRWRRVLVGSAVAVGAAAILAVGWLGWRAGRFRMDPMGVSGGVRLVYRVDVPAHAPNRPDLIARAVEAVRQRVRSFNRYADARPIREGIEVLIPTVKGTLEIEELKRQIERSGRLEFKLVDDGSDYMRVVAAEVRRWTYPEVAVLDESWEDKSTGQTHQDLFLAGERPEPLLSAFERIPGADVVPADHEIRVERRAKDWRTYYVFARSYVDNADVRSADQVWSQDTGRPEVSIEVGPAGSDKLSRLTESSVGRKMAIVFEGRILMAPVIISKIPNGRVRIALGAGDDVYKLHEEAKDLAAVLRVQPLPAPIVLLSEETVSPRK